MSPQAQMILAVMALASFVMGVLGFLALNWKLAWSVAKFVTAQEAHAMDQRETGRAIAGSIGEFVAAQREANARTEARLKAVEERQDQQAMTARMLARKVFQVTADDVERENEASA